MNGYEIACRLIEADKALDSAISKLVELEMSKKKKDKVALPEARQRRAAASEARMAVIYEADAYKAKHGTSVQDAYEATCGRRYPYYM